MKRFTVILVFLAFCLLIFTQSTQAQAPAPAPAPKAAEPKKAEPMKAGPKSTEWKIQNAMSAAPRSISKAATVLDWPAKEGGDMVVLRKGTNDWTCIVDDPGTPATPCAWTRFRCSGPRRG